MCTVTVIRPEEDGGAVLRLACNRDESRARPAALPPRIIDAGPRRAVMPIDPAGGGTWIAATDAGLILTLLNAHPGAGADTSRGAAMAGAAAASAGKTAAAPAPPSGTSPATAARPSRGGIIPMLLPAGRLDEAIAAAEQIDTRPYAPFRLVIADRDEVAELRPQHGRLVTTLRAPADRPRFFTSSGLGDGLVEGPRRALFDTRIDGRPATRALQDAFHRERDPDRPELGVNMSRADARTVSYTVVELGPNEVRLLYHPDAPDRPATPAAVTLALRPPAATAP
jgi:hypothetical protein